jgi:hypothetical protein
MKLSKVLIRKTCMTKQISILTAAVLAAGTIHTTAAHAVLIVNSATYNYSQNFDSLASSNSGLVWTNDSTLSGWSLFRQSAPGTAITAYSAGNGSSNIGSFYSFGSIGNTERALGGLGSGGNYFGSPASGNVAGWIAVAFRNGTASALDGFTVAFDGEQWRNGGNTTVQTMVLEYGFGSDFTNVATWNAPGGAFDWASPVATASAAAIDGNTAGRVASRGDTINTAWNAGETLWIRWVERNDLSNDHGMAIDNFSLNVITAAIPEAGTFAYMALGLGLAGLMGRRRKT